MINLREPILSPFLKNRPICLAITAVTILQLSLVFAGLPAWQSPIHALFGLPDLGCGLSRAIIALLRGDWQTSLTFHAFAPLFVIALTLIVLAAILPSVIRDKVAMWIETLERRTGLTAFLLIGLVVYWLARMLIMREAFFQLVK